MPPLRRPSQAVPDCRIGYIRSLWRHARSADAAYKEKHWQHLCAAIARLAVEERHVPDRHMVRDCINGIGGATLSLLEQAEADGLQLRAPPQGRYASAAAAMLVALYEHAEAAPPSPGPIKCPKTELLRRAMALSEQPFCPAERHLKPPDGAAGGRVRCAAFQQMATLQTLLYVKERQDKRACETGVVYELLEAGREAAATLRSAGEARPAAPLMHSGRPGAGEAAVLLLVDDREQGGAWRGAGLREFCAALGRSGARYETRRLGDGAGDFSFVACSPGGQRPLPLLVERKGVDDIAASLKDGRWGKQQEAMARRNEALFGGGATVRYILEGVRAGRLTPFGCPCGRCAGRAADPPVGGCSAKGWPSMRQAIRGLVEISRDYPR